MDYCRITLHAIDWTAIRQSLALSLLSGRPVLIPGGGDYLKKNERLFPVMEDIEEACRVLGAGTIDWSGTDISFKPRRPAPGTFELKGGKFSSAMEVVLFLLPVLFELDFRTVLNITGVTHSVLSCTTSFVRESLYPLLEQAGLYASMSLRRFGFYGSGEGSLEVRAYPAERKEAVFTMQGGGYTLEGVRILFSGVLPELAKREKQQLCEALSLPDEKISILEIRNAAGFGNSLEAFIKSGGETFVVFRELSFYNHAGDFIFDEEALNQAMAEFTARVKHVLEHKRPPFMLCREAVPFCGPDIIKDSCVAGDNEQLLLHDAIHVYNTLIL